MVALDEDPGSLMDDEMGFRCPPPFLCPPTHPPQPCSGLFVVLRVYSWGSYG